MVGDQEAKKPLQADRGDKGFCHIHVFNPAPQKPEHFFFLCHRRKREETEK